MPWLPYIYLITKISKNYRDKESSNWKKKFALDRIISLEETVDNFEYPKDFNAEIFFKDCYGVICGTNGEVQKIVLRAYPPYVNYLRTLPLHTSQKELNSTSDYADFELYLRLLSTSVKNCYLKGMK